MTCRAETENMKISKTQKKHTKKKQIKLLLPSGGAAVTYVMHGVALLVSEVDLAGVERANEHMNGRTNQPTNQAATKILNQDQRLLPAVGWLGRQPLKNTSKTDLPSSKITYCELWMHRVKRLISYYNFCSPEQLEKLSVLWITNNNLQKQVNLQQNYERGLLAT